MSYFGQQEELGMEYRRIARRLDDLYAAQLGGDSSVYTRQRIGRLEALQQALMGCPGALSGE
ncbi:hypothetical protein [Streptomyces sp. NPDC058441]|uniref:hypothetical protein n=1 Tax=Streptomyces sp. NPDC058441 TaxID=3346502 RepID=UPI003657EDA4